MEEIATCFLGDKMIVKQNSRNERTPLNGIATFFEFQQYNVIYLDITSFVSSAGRQGISLQEIPNIIVNALHEKFLTVSRMILRHLKVQMDVLAFLVRLGYLAYHET